MAGNSGTPAVERQSSQFWHGDFGQIEAFELGEDPARADDVLVMIHAAGTGAQTLLPLAEMLLRPGRSILIPNLDMYGQTRVHRGDDRPWRHVQVVGEALRRAGPDVRLIGHSFGGWACMRTLAFHGGEADRVLLIEPVALGAIQGPEDADALAVDRKAVFSLQNRLAAGDPDAVADFITVWNGTDWNLLPEKARATLRGLTSQIAGDCAETSFDTTPADAYRDIACPITLIGTEKGPVPALRILERLAPVLGADVQIVAGQNHMGPVMQPAAFVPVIRRFLGD